MDFLELFTLKDVGIVLVGLILASIVRIYFDSHVTKQKAKQFGSSLGIYNNLLDETKEGLFIIDDMQNVIYANKESENILQYTVNKKNISNTSLKVDDYNNDENNLLNIISTKEYLPHAKIINNSKSISLSINRFKPFFNDTVWSIIVIQDMTNINELREGASNLLDT